MFVMGDFHTGILSDFCDLFLLTKIVKFDTCFNKTHTKLIDIVLTNKPSSFNKTPVSDTGLSGYHKMVTTFTTFSNYIF